MGFDYTNNAEPLDSEEYITNPLSDPLKHIQAIVDERLGKRAAIDSTRIDDMNSRQAMSQKAEDFIGGHVFFGDRGDLKESNRPPAQGRFSSGSLSDGTGGEGDPPKESLFGSKESLADGTDGGLPSMEELAPHRWDRECYEVAGAVANQWPHLQEDAGFYAHPQRGIGDHGWNIAPDGTIVDMSATQHDYADEQDEQDEDHNFPAPQHPEVIPPDHPYYDRYISWERHPEQAQILAHNHGYHENPAEYEGICPLCSQPKQGKTAGINHDPGQFARGVLAPSGEVHTWPEDWGTHAAFITNVLKDHNLGNYANFALSPGGDIQTLGNDDRLHEIQAALSNHAMQAYAKTAAHWMMNPEDVEDFTLGQCAAFAAAHQQAHPELRFGLDWEKMTPDHPSYDWDQAYEDGYDETNAPEQWRVQHVFTHDDHNAYDAEGIHPLPYQQWDKAELNRSRADVENTGMLEPGYMPDQSWMMEKAPWPRQTAAIPGKPGDTRGWNCPECLGEGYPPGSDTACRQCHGTGMMGAADYPGAQNIDFGEPVWTHDPNEVTQVFGPGPVRQGSLEGINPFAPGAFSDYPYDWPLDPGHTQPGEEPGVGLCPECQGPLKRDLDANYCPNCKAYHKEGRGGPGFIDPTLDAALRQNYTPYAPQPAPQPLLMPRDPQRDPQAWVKSLTDAYTKGAISVQQYEQMLENGYRLLYQRGTEPFDLPRVSAMTRSQKMQLAQQLEELHGQPDMSEVLHEFPDGFSIRKLKTAGDMNREGELMSHCWRKSFWENPTNVEEWGTSYPEHHDLLAEQWDAPIGKRRDYLSLRDPDNFPRVSMYGYPRWGENGQYIEPDAPTGAHNAPVKPEFQQYLDQWVETQKNQPANEQAANVLSSVRSRKHPTYFRDEHHKPFHCHPLTGKRCYCPWGWNALETWRRDQQHEASQNVRMLRNQNRKVFRDEKGQAFLEHLHNLVNGFDWPMTGGRVVNTHYPELEPVVPWLAHRYAKGDVELRPGIKADPDSLDPLEQRGRTPRLLWAGHYPVDDHHVLSVLPYRGLSEWFNARQAPHRRGVNIMDLAPHEVNAKVNEHQAWVQEKELREMLGDRLADTGTPVHQFGNGWHVRELTSPDDLDAEGEAMDHCIGDRGQGYHEGLENGLLKAYSLRDKDGWPHATWHINTRDNTLAHVQGASGTPRSDYRDKVTQFNNHMGYGDNPVGDYDYQEPQYDAQYELPAADTVNDWLGLHGSNGSAWDYATDDPYANIGEDTELIHQEPEWDQIASDFLDYGPHAQWDGGGPPHTTHTEDDRTNFMQELHEQCHADSFNKALHENASPSTDPDHAEALRLWNEASAPHTDQDGNYVAPSWQYNREGFTGYVPVTDPRHPEYEPPRYEQLGMDIEASNTTSETSVVRVPHDSKLRKGSGRRTCETCGGSHDNWMASNCRSCLNNFVRSAGGPAQCPVHTTTTYVANLAGRRHCPRCSLEALAPDLRTKPTEHAEMVPTVYNAYLERGYGADAASVLAARRMYNQLRAEGVPDPLSMEGANYHVNKYLDSLEQDPNEQPQQDNPE